MLLKNNKMIPIKIYKEYGEEFKALADIDSFTMVVSEKHLTRKLKDKTGTVLAFVYPSADAMGGGDADNDGKEVIGLLFVLNKVDVGSEDECDELNNYEQLQAALLSVEAKMKTDFKEAHPVMEGFDINSIHIDPEYQTFGHYNGWSMSFKLKWY